MNDRRWLDGTGVVGWRVVLILLLSVYSLKVHGQTAPASQDATPPNIVVIFTDDQGYGDLSCFGSTTIATPRLDSLARDGTRFTSFYAQVVCGPSRSALLTGRYPNRSLGWSMPGEEVTIAELLKQRGYATACVGKWDVSNRAATLDRMPLAQGFDEYFGTLGANDSGRVLLHKNNQALEETSDMASLTRMYTDHSIDFITRNRNQPFFLYLAHTMTHSVIDASPEFRGKSGAGLFGDTVQELDYHSGRLLDAIDNLGLREKTLVLFTTDNGAWNNFRETLEKRHNGQVAWGSSGPLREGKGSTYEGGLRVPCLARWPGKIPAGRTNDAIFATIDFLPTFAKLAGATVPQDRYIDGVDQTALLLGQSETGSRSDYFYFCKNELHAVRKGNYKLLLPDRRQHYNYVKDKGSRVAELYDVARDIGEKQDLAAQQPEIVRQLMLHATSLPWPDVKPDDRIALPSAAANPANALKVSSRQLSPDVKQEIDRIFEEGIQRQVIPGGSIMLVHAGEVVLRQAYGLADLVTKQPFSVDAPCRIASLTKPHTATLLSILAEQKLIDLNDPIDKYLPEFKELKVSGGGAVKRAPTLAECLSHTAGFPGNRAGNGAGNRAGNQRPTPTDALTLGEAVRQLAQQPLTTQPGTSYDYSGAGYMVAGRVAEVVTGRTFQDLMRRHLLEPIGAQTATFTPGPAVRNLMPTAYQRTPSGLVPHQRETAPRFVNPGGSMISTLDDVARLMLLHRNQGRVDKRQVVTAQSLTRMWTAQPATPGTGYGLGFNIVAKRSDGSAQRIRHTGASGTFAMLDFDQDLIVIIFTQVDQNDITAWRGRLVQAIGKFSIAKE